ncbi:hemophore-related protein [Tsukamurella asaccharolytica]|uniref:Hemophore-related protein n=1 Tax=Tsukamurella asaccharolytica TaxID=2592067 RepID=A0A5C5R5Y6_9ACTN|nr:hemophore-related protein [Tsukamurella asaccharolytica]TWS18459.1 hemophore-related protein [Tsukamurella asaccharolytica]
MTFRRTAATAAVLGAIALAGAPLAAAAPTPAPPKPDAQSARAVPGTSCTVGQLRAAIDRSSPGLSKRLEEAAGGPQEFADIAASDGLVRQVRVAALAFRGTGSVMSLAGEQANVQRAVADAYSTCATAKAK